MRLAHLLVRGEAPVVELRDRLAELQGLRLVEIERLGEAERADEAHAALHPRGIAPPLAHHLALPHAAALPGPLALRRALPCPRRLGEGGERQHEQRDEDLLPHTVLLSSVDLL